MAYSRFSQFFILDPRGDTLISKDFRGDVPRESAEKFFRHVKFWGGKQQDAPPIFFLDKTSFMYLKVNGLWFVGTTNANVCGSLQMELLNRLTRAFKDYCGIISEESIRKNFILLYELLDEILDYGYVQDTSTEMLKAYVFNEPNVATKTNMIRSITEKIKTGELKPKSTPSSSTNVPISWSGKNEKNRGSSNKKNEIFVDIFERISVTFGSNGSPLSSSIDGTIQMKSYLIGNPELRLALNEDLIIGKSGGSTMYGGVVLDDINFHECARLDEFEQNRTLRLAPPEGEFALINYRVTNEFRQPFRIFPFFELVSPYKVELIIKIRADIPEQNYGTNVGVELPVPANCQTVTPEMSTGVVGQKCEFDLKNRKVVWKIKKFPGGSEQALRVKITFKEQQTVAVRKAIGPISMDFEIPMFNVSNLQVRYLRILEESKGYNPFRWVRYVTRSQSYICRL